MPRPTCSAVLRALVLALILAAPLASGKDTLSSLEEPRKGADQVWDVTITAEEAARTNLVVFRNAPSAVFGLIVYDANGTEVYVKNGTRGLQTLPKLAAGDYRFFVRGSGEFQVTEKGLERLLTGNVSTTLAGTDAYVLAPSRHYRIDFAGDVDVEFWNMVEAKEQLEAPFSRNATQGGAYVFTVRGAEGTPYSLTLTPIAAPPEEKETPGVGIVGFALALAFALVLRRR